MNNKTFGIDCLLSFPKKKPFEWIFRSSKIMASSSVRKKIVAVCQMTATNSKEDNMRICSELIKSAKERDCLVCSNH